MAHFRRIKKGFGWPLTLALVSFLALMWLQGPRLGDEFRVDEDFRTFYWMNKFQDPALFPDQLEGYQMVDLFGLKLPVTFRSLGFGLLFYAASFFVPPILFSKILPFFIMPITLWHLFKLGQALHRPATGLILAFGFLFVNLASSSSISIANGLQRSFAIPLIVALIYYLYRQKFLAAAAVIVLSALIYPPMFVLGTAIWGLSMLMKNRQALFTISLFRRGLTHLLIAAGLGVLVLLPAFPILADVFGASEPEAGGLPAAAAQTPPEPDKSIWDNPLYGAGGSAQLFVIFPIVGRGGLVDLGDDLVNLLILLALAGFIILAAGRAAFRLPAEIWGLLAASLLVFALAWAAIGLTGSFLLYLPSRYTRVGLFLFLLLFVLLNGPTFVQQAPVMLQRHPQRLIWVITGFEVLVLGLVLFYPSNRAMISGLNLKWFLAPAGLALGALGAIIIRKPLPAAPRLSGLSRTLPGRILIGGALVLGLGGWAAYAPLFTEVSYLNPPPEERALFEFLETLPRDVLIAGSPCALDSVPLFARRQILFSCEKPRWQEPAVVRAALAAYYTHEGQQVVDFCRNYGVDYLVIDLKSYSKRHLAEGQIFFEPYNREVRAAIAGQEQFVLAQLPDENKLFRSKNFFVVSCDQLAVRQAAGG